MSDNWGNGGGWDGWETPNTPPQNSGMDEVTGTIPQNEGRSPQQAWNNGQGAWGNDGWGSQPQQSNGGQYQEYPHQQAPQGAHQAPQGQGYPNQGYQQNGQHVNGNQHEQNAQQNEVQSPSKVKTIISMVLVLLVAIGFILGIMQLTKVINKGRTPSASEIEKVVSSSAPASEVEQSSSEVTQPSSSTEVGTAESSQQVESSTSSDTLGGSRVSLDGAVVSPEVLQNTAKVLSITPVVENDLLVTYDVKFSMGSTTLSLVLNYEQAEHLAVGDSVTVRYSKVEGQDKVVIRSIGG